MASILHPLLVTYCLILVQTPASRASPHPALTVVSTFPPEPSGFHPSGDTSGPWGTFDCTDLNPSTPDSTACWDMLNLTDWLTGWAPMSCDILSENTASNCCQPSESWSTCFLRLYIGGNGAYDCTNISQGSCDFSPSTLSGNGSLPGNERPQIHYIVRNIFTINHFFNDWYDASQDATMDSSFIIQSLVDTIDPDRKANVLLQDVVTAIAAALAFLVLPEAAPALAAISFETLTFGKALLTGLQQSPSVARAIWPSGTSDSQSYQIAQLYSDLETISLGVSNNINAGLLELMTNKSAFAAFASSGEFSGSTGFSIVNDTEALTSTLQLFLVSKAFNGNNIKGHIRNITSSDVNSLSGPHSGSVGEYYLCGQNGIDVCYKNATLGYTWGPGPVDTAIYNSVVENGWANITSLLKGAYDCTQQGQMGKGLVNFNADGSIDMSCMSQLEECFYGPSTLEPENSLIKQC